MTEIVPSSLEIGCWPPARSMIDGRRMLRRERAVDEQALAVGAAVHDDVAHRLGDRLRREDALLEREELAIPHMMVFSVGSAVDGAGAAEALAGGVQQVEAAVELAYEVVQGCRRARRRSCRR